MKRLVKRGFTLVEIMIVVAIIALLAAIAIPNVLRGRTTANESAAVGNLRALVSSLEMYRSVNNVYPVTANWMTDMYTTPNPDFGPPSFAHVMDNTACPTGAASSCTQGYRYNFQSAAGVVYNISATPDNIGNTGTRSFFVDDSGVIRHCLSAGAGVTATVTDPTIDATAVNC